MSRWEDLPAEKAEWLLIVDTELERLRDLPDPEDQ